MVDASRLISLSVGSETARSPFGAELPRTRNRRVRNAFQNTFRESVFGTPREHHYTSKASVTPVTVSRLIVARAHAFLWTAVALPL